MGWLWAIIVGLVLGLIAKAILPGKQQIPLWLTASSASSAASSATPSPRGIGVDDTRGIDWTRHLLQLVGAVVVVGSATWLWTSMRGTRKQTGLSAPTTATAGRAVSRGCPAAVVLCRRPVSRP